MIELPLGERFRLDAVCTEFERDRAAGGETPVEEYLGRVSPELRSALLAELRRCEGDLRGGAVPAVPGFEILGEVGRGGMGVVYKAVQASVGRVVALKVILAGEFAAPGEVSRFRAESRAVAALRHPNVVQVFDAGEHDGRPYQVLEFCDGGGLDRALKERPLAAREAAALALGVARGVAAAHAAGVVHRDLKPANVLLSYKSHKTYKSYESAKIADFGLAKRLDATRHTQDGAVVGTPSYMSPEQADGRDAGAAADVWALGAILYECVTGRALFRAESVARTLRLVIEAEPVAPRLLAPGLPRDLENVCLMCLRKEPSRSYESAADLADDLRRFLDGNPVRARPVAAWTRAARWSRRNPAVAALLVGLVAALAVALWQWRGAAQSEGEARRARATAADSERDMRQALANSTVIINRMFMNAPQLGKDDREAVVKATEAMLPLLERVSDDKELNQIAFGVLQLSDALNRGGENEFALRVARRAGDTLRRLSEDHPERLTYRANYSQACVSLVSPLKALGRIDEAAAALEEALRVVEELLLLRPENDTLKTHQAGYWGALGHCHEIRGRLELAEPLYRDSLKEVYALQRRWPDDRLRYGSVGMHSWRYAALLKRKGDLRESLRVLTEAVALAEKARATRGDWPDFVGDLFQSYHQAAIVHEEMGQPDKAIELVRRALELHRERMALRGATPALRQQQAGMTLVVGCFLWRKDRAEAAPLLREALAEAEKLVTESGGEAAARHNLARELLGCPDPSQRDPLRCLAMAERAAHADPANAAYVWTRAFAMCEAGDHAAAATELSRLIPRLRPLDTPDLAAEAHGYLALALSYLPGRADEARRALREAEKYKALHPFADQSSFREIDEAKHRLDAAPR